MLGEVDAGACGRSGLSLAWWFRVELDDLEQLVGAVLVSEGVAAAGELVAPPLDVLLERAGGKRHVGQRWSGMRAKG